VQPKLVKQARLRLALLRQQRVHLYGTRRVRRRSSDLEEGYVEANVVSGAGGYSIFVGRFSIARR
jgi:hypothetical protein